MTQMTTSAPPAPEGSAFNRLGARIRDFTFAQKALGIIGIAVLVLGGAALYWASTQPQMTQMYTDLDPADASLIVEQLQADGVSYELTGGGGTVMVPQDQVYEARIRAAGAGLPHSTRGGYGLLDDMGVTSSDFQQSVTYKRALEGELGGTIQSMDGVQTAAVVLSIPEETVFADSQEEPTASIFVQVTPGVSFADRQVQAVSHLVAAAVDGLEPENVAVVDGGGQLLASVGNDTVGGTSGTSAEYENRVTHAVSEMLETVVGRGNSTVTVNAAMSQESSELLEEIFEEPEGSPALSETSNSEEYSGTGSGAGGVLGPDNIAVPGGDGEGSYTSEQTELQNAVNKVTQTTNIPAGILTRQTISVAVDQEAAAGVNVPQLEAMIADAVGMDEERGDSLNVSLVPFSTADSDAAAEALAAAEAAEAEERRAEMLRTVLEWGAVALAGMVALVVWLIIANRRRRRREQQLIDLGEAYETQALPAAAHADPALSDTAVTQTLPAAHIPPGLQMAPEAELAAQRRTEINTMASEDPARMADHLRALMDQEAEKV